MVNEEKVIYSLPGVYESLEHTGDVYIRVRGRSLLDLFEKSGLALFDTMTDIRKIESKIEKEVVVEGFDLDNLLYKWLEALLVIYYSENLMCGSIVVDELVIKRVGEELSYVLKGRACCEEFNPEKHEARVEVKSPTYSLMKILKTTDEWIAYFVLDI
ncbi:MAG: archease [Desulfurococcaceae archaeon]